MAHHDYVVIDSNEGPYGLHYVGGYHSHCWYGNEVTLTRELQQNLAFVAAHKKPGIPLFVYEITKTNKTKGKMYFSAPFSRMYLHKHLAEGIEHFKVRCNASTTVYDMKFYVSTDDRANLTTGWTFFMDDLEINVDATCVFEFYEEHEELKLTVHQL
uniref:TF-B3 domain-containing protein n=1 Tax=Oryza rufipogon TaxID=4529 RepID=A0A0E0PQR0_ORYRU